ncbi:50S ribosomal protein L28 [bacterium]|nr:50S ribosomal protein L28 [bacterium]
MRCEICGKKPGKGHRVSYSKKKTIRRFKPNIQKVRVFYRGKWQRMRICTKCRKKLLRALAVQES